MKNIFQYNKLLLILLFTIALTSCKKDFLEITPKGKLIAQTTDDYYKLLNDNNFLTILFSYGGGSSQVILGDEVASVEPYFNGSALNVQRLFRWDAVIYEPDEDADEMAVPMKNIYAYNKIINEVGAATEGSEEKKQSILAEALAGRAWTYFLLINYFGLPYNEVTSAKDPGFPIITKADVTETQFTRASVNDVYDFIVEDLTTAIANLPIHTPHRIRMSKTAAEGLLGKVYMFMGKFNEALPHLNASIDSLATSSIPMGLIDYNAAFTAPNGIFLPVGLFGPTFPGAFNNIENVYAKQFINSWTFTNNEIIASKETADLYKPSDLRLKFYDKNAFFGSSYPNGMLRKIGPTATQIGVVVPDLYLLRAECKARLDDLEGSEADVKTLRENRMPIADAALPPSIASDKKALVKFILEERIREFAVTGYRWFDMRRLSVDPEYSSTIKNTHTLYNEDGSVKETFTLTPERYALRFTQKLMDQNPGMLNND